MRPPLRNRRLANALARFEAWRRYTLQAICQSLKRVACFFRGHDIAVRMKPDGTAMARVWTPKGYRCHRCWQGVKERPKRKYD